MDGSKQNTDTADYATTRRCREASRRGRSMGVSSCGPDGNENPAGSSSKRGLDSHAPKGLGFPGNVEQPGVSRS